MISTVKAQDINNLNESVKDLAEDANKKEFAKKIFDVSKNDRVKKISIENLRNAINNLEENFSNNCCQSVNLDCCQLCQSCQACQTCQRQCNCNCDCDSH